ncbi:copper amine oxidase [Panaeolus papilionaceus]|nr:copper amine oxidase [Panaeolus papilionaceus]
MESGLRTLVSPLAVIKPITTYNSNRYDITHDLLCTYINTTSTTSSLRSIDPPWEEDGRIIEWAQYRLAPNNIGIPPSFLRGYITGRDPAGWKLLGIYSGGVFYESTEEFREAWKKPDFFRTEKTFVTQSMMTNRTGDALPYDIEAPLVQVQIQKCWTVDKEQKPYTYELVEGYDCPLNSDYLDTLLHMDGNTTTNFDSICLYESDTGFPIQRHTTRRMATVTRNTFFNLRFVSTIGNYDYQFTYSFLLDGSIEVAVRASSYIQSTYYYSNEEYGCKIRKHLSGSMHDHVLTFKADLDIKGEKNTFETTKFVPVKVKYRWDKEMNTMKVERSLLKNETKARSTGLPMALRNTASSTLRSLTAGANTLATASLLVMVTPIHSTAIDSSLIKDSSHLATHYMYVTKQKDTERHLMHSTNNMDSGKPLVDFSKFFDGENLEHDDITLACIISPTPRISPSPSCPPPNPPSPSALRPHNYLSSGPSRQTVQQVELDLTSDRVVVDTYKKLTVCQAPPVIVDSDYSDFQIDYTVSKTPKPTLCANC